MRKLPDELAGRLVEHFGLNHLSAQDKKRVEWLANNAYRLGADNDTMRISKKDFAFFTAKESKK